ncbi:Anhydro-N-acetylmuramic acid kinase [Fervidicola ferrireducens]|uniref:Anhydro-N-acetylmuramic acid kinase n=1 Tax=Fervidicola ferrireducens TaxID=520764 RepID=A0A140LD10_9FIRM|nr:anhydro-N-acetylmuramic acid kinase [Fervidicola ferrireducens]KXG78435.1 Anhydro-N-acetylmuramic acid kinase [Fervidicola ferrireducens]
MEKLYALYKKKRKKVIGLMSGTSADGIDAALVEIEGYGPGSQVELLAFYNFPYDESVRREIFKLFDLRHSTADLICRMNFKLGEYFGKAALRLCELSGIDIRDVDLIGSHGQTIYHIPGEATLQIGEPSVIAELTGRTVVADFRVRDIAAGGHGAPLVPYVEYLLYKSTKVNRALLNIGGIANITLIPKECMIDDVTAFDTGPGNMMIDEIVRWGTRGRMRFDEGGAIASKGKVDERLIEILKTHPYLKLQPPKTAGREFFGKSFTENIIEKAIELKIGFEDLVTTVTYFTAYSIGRAVKDFVLPKCKIDEILVSGGGAYNNTLVRMIKDEMKGIEVRTLEEIGQNSDAKEAIAFAVLANETIGGVCNNVPGATGAKKRVILGKIIV